MFNISIKPKTKIDSLYIGFPLFKLICGIFTFNHIYLLIFLFVVVYKRLSLDTAGLLNKKINFGISTKSQTSNFK